MFVKESRPVNMQIISIFSNCVKNNIAEYPGSVKKINQ